MDQTLFTLTLMLTRLMTNTTTEHFGIDFWFLFYSSYGYAVERFIWNSEQNNEFALISGHGETSWCFSQIKGALDDDVTDADIISCVEFNHDGELLATGDKGGRVVIFQVIRSFSCFCI